MLRTGHGFLEFHLAGVHVPRTGATTVSPPEVAYSRTPDPVATKPEGLVIAELARKETWLRAWREAPPAFQANQLQTAP